MVKNHLKRLAMPKSWPIKRKGITFVVRPNPGAHQLHMGMPLALALRDLLNMARSMREVRFVLKTGSVLVDYRKVDDPQFMIGLMDSLTVLKQYYRILLDRYGKLKFIKVDEPESKVKVCKITGKTKVKGKTQINLYDGKNILVDSDEYKVGDSIFIELPSCKIKEHFKFAKGSHIYLIGGGHCGASGVVDSIAGNKLIFKLATGETFETSKKYAFVVGKDKPAVMLGENK